MIEYIYGAMGISSVLSYWLGRTRTKRLELKATDFFKYRVLCEVAINPPSKYKISSWKGFTGDGNRNISWIEHDRYPFIAQLEACVLSGEVEVVVIKDADDGGQDLKHVLYVLTEQGRAWLASRTDESNKKKQ